ncbi:UNVERIFIED_ORG: hypothetical protein QQG_1873, partial [Clostridioides difficile Y384]
MVIIFFINKSNIYFMKEDYINIYLNRKNCKKHKNN